MIYVVKQGDYLAKIAHDNGFSDFKALWDLPQNAKLKAARKNPNVLFPGDQIFLPDLGPRFEPSATGKRNTFVTKQLPLNLRIVLRGIDSKPLAGEKCTMEVEGTSKVTEADGAGMLQTPMEPTVKKGRLTFNDFDSPFDSSVKLDIAVGELDPETTASGQIGRLNNLGYDAGEFDTLLDEPDNPAQFRSAIEEFQCDNGLTVDGVCGPQTQAKLLKVHGC